MTAIAAPAAQSKPAKPKPRHAKPSLYRRAATAVPTRIPKPVLAAWDAADRNRLVAVSGTALTASLVAAVWVPHVAVVALVAVAALSAGLCVRISELGVERERRMVLEAENAGLKAALRTAVAGDATAVTQKMLVIGGDDA